MSLVSFCFRKHRRSNEILKAANSCYILRGFNHLPELKIEPKYSCPAMSIASLDNHYGKRDLENTI